MAGQDATLSVKEAKAQIERTCACRESNHAINHGGSGKKMKEASSELMKKQKHQG